MPVAAPADRRFRRARVRPPRRRRSWLIRLVAVARTAGSLAVFLGGAYFLTHQVAQARALHVDRITVRGNERLSTGEVMVLLEGLRGQHLLAVDLGTWQRRLLSSPWVEHAGVRRVLPSTVEISIREREPMAIGRVGVDLYLVDPVGHIIDEYGPDYAQFDLPVVDGLATAPSAGGPLIDGGRAMLANRLIAALSRNKTLYRRVSQIDVANARDAVVILKDDTALVHLGDDQFLERLQAYVDLAATLRQQVPEIEYVDLRFENRVYVRPASQKGSRRR
jgi:cell division septal protein FtsQ